MPSLSRRTRLSPPAVKPAGRLLAELDAADIADALVRLRLQLQDQCGGRPLPGMLEALALVQKIGRRA